MRGKWSVASVIENEVWLEEEGRVVCFCNVAVVSTRPVLAFHRRRSLARAHSPSSTPLADHLPRKSIRHSSPSTHAQPSSRDIAICLLQKEKSGRDEWNVRGMTRSDQEHDCKIDASPRCRLSKHHHPFVCQCITMPSSVSASPHRRLSQHYHPVLCQSIATPPSVKASPPSTTTVYHHLLPAPPTHLTSRVYPSAWSASSAYPSGPLVHGCGAARNE